VKNLTNPMAKKRAVPFTQGSTISITDGYGSIAVFNRDAPRSGVCVNMGGTPPGSEIQLKRKNDYGKAHTPYDGHDTQPLQLTFRNVQRIRQQVRPIVEFAPFAATGRVPPPCK